jgi:N-acetylglucosamine-6-phosphate deacetylase
MTDLEHDNYVHPGPRFARNGFTTGQGQGMSLRDAAALVALQGFCSQTDSSGTWSWLPDMAAAEAWRMADAFIAARETKEDEG